MKKIIASITMLAAGAALASTVSSDQTFGVLKVTSSNKDTVVSVPWVAAGSGGDVQVKDFVKTTGLKEGDVLLKYDNSTGTYYGWQLDADNGSWVGAAVVIENGPAVTEDDDATLARGDALIIRRNGTPLSDGIYLYGQYNSTAVANYQMTYDSVNYTSKTTLFAPVNTDGDEIYLNGDTEGGWTSGSKYLKWTNIKVGDRIEVQSASGYRVPFVYNGRYWTADGTKAGTLKAGQGAWFVGAAGERNNAPTVRIATTLD